MSVGTIEQPDLDQETSEREFFTRPGIVKYDEKWRNKHSNKHRPSYKRGPGKGVMREIRRPGFDDVKFEQIQETKAPSVEEQINDLSFSPNRFKRRVLFSVDYIQPDWDVPIALGDEGEILYASY